MRVPHCIPPRFCVCVVFAYVIISEIMTSSGLASKNISTEAIEEYCSVYREHADRNYALAYYMKVSTK